MAGYPYGTTAPVSLACTSLVLRTFVRLFDYFFLSSIVRLIPIIDLRVYRVTNHYGKLKRIIKKYSDLQLFYYLKILSGIFIDEKFDFIFIFVQYYT